MVGQEPAGDLSDDEVQIERTDGGSEDKKATLPGAASTKGARPQPQAPARNPGASSQSTIPVKIVNVPNLEAQMDVAVIRFRQLPRSSSSKASDAPQRRSKRKLLKHEEGYGKKGNAKAGPAFLTPMVHAASRSNFSADALPHFVLYAFPGTCSRPGDVGYEQQKPPPTPTPTPAAATKPKAAPGSDEAPTTTKTGPKSSEQKKPSESVHAAPSKLKRTAAPDSSTPAARGAHSAGHKRPLPPDSTSTDLPLETPSQARRPRTADDTTPASAAPPDSVPAPGQFKRSRHAPPDDAQPTSAPSLPSGKRDRSAAANEEAPQVGSAGPRGNERGVLEGGNQLKRSRPGQAADPPHSHAQRTGSHAHHTEAASRGAAGHASGSGKGASAAAAAGYTGEGSGHGRGSRAGEQLSPLVTEMADVGHAGPRAAGAHSSGRAHASAAAAGGVSGLGRLKGTGAAGQASAPSTSPLEHAAGLAAEGREKGAEGVGGRSGGQGKPARTSDKAAALRQLVSVSTERAGESSDPAKALAEFLKANEDAIAEMERLEDALQKSYHAIAGMLEHAAKSPHSSKLSKAETAGAASLTKLCKRLSHEDAAGAGSRAQPSHSPTPPVRQRLRDAWTALRARPSGGAGGTGASAASGAAPSAGKRAVSNEEVERRVSEAVSKAVAEERQKQAEEKEQAIANAVRQARTEERQNVLDCALAAPLEAVDLDNKERRVALQAAAMWLAPDFDLAGKAAAIEDCLFRTWAGGEHVTPKYRARVRELTSILCPEGIPGIYVPEAISSLWTEAAGAGQDELATPISLDDLASANAVRAAGNLRGKLWAGGIDIMQFVTADLSDLQKQAA